MLKRMYLLLILTVISTAVFAQVQLGIRAGLNLTNLEQHKNGERNQSSLKTGLNAGLTADFSLGNRFLLQPGILYSSKGFKDYGATKLKATAHYIELPVTLIYKYALGSGNVIAGAGPYIAYGLSGKWLTPEYLDGFNSRTAMEGVLQFTNDTDRHHYYFITPGEEYTFGKALDWGANVLIGYEIQKFTLQFNGQFGIANLAPKVDGDVTSDKLRNIGVGLSVGYKFLSK